MRKIVFVVTLLGLLFTACNHHKVVYEHLNTFSNKDWKSGEKLHYKMRVEADKAYTLQAILLTNGDYKASGLSIILACRFSNGQTLLRELPFKSSKGASLFSTAATTLDTLMLRPHLSVREHCDLEVELSLRSPYFNNKGIESLRFMLVEE